MAKAEIDKRQKTIEMLQKELALLDDGNEPKRLELKRRINAEALAILQIERDGLVEQIERKNEKLTLDSEQGERIRLLPRPRATYTAGKVDRVDAKDSSIVEIWYDIDVTLVPGDKLLVFRNQPLPQNIGSIQVTKNIFLGRALARFTPVVRGVTIQAGDAVASHVNALPAPGAKFEPSVSRMEVLRKGAGIKLAEKQKPHILIEFDTSILWPLQAKLEVARQGPKGKFLGFLKIVSRQQDKFLCEFQPAVRENPVMPTTGDFAVLSPTFHPAER
jgi:hypothetical protein